MTDDATGGSRPGARMSPKVGQESSAEGHEADLRGEDFLGGAPPPDKGRGDAMFRGVGKADKWKLAVFVLVVVAMAVAGAAEFAR